MENRSWEFTWFGYIDHLYFDFEVGSFIVNDPSFALFWDIKGWSTHFWRINREVNGVKGFTENTIVKV